MKLSKRMIVASGVAAALTLGSAGAVVAEGVHGQGPASVLSSLVHNGTLTQAQADKVGAALSEHRAQLQKDRQARRAAMQKVIADTLGISVADLQAKRQAGQNLGEIAGAKKDALKSAMVAQINKVADEAVKSGKISSDRATKVKADASARVDAILAGHKFAAPKSQ